VKTPPLSFCCPPERKERAVSPPPIDEAELNAMLLRAGLALTPEQVRAIFPGAEIFRRMLERVNAPLPREAEPALTFTAEQG
jgi:hypothetical protein